MSWLDTYSMIPKDNVVIYTFWVLPQRNHHFCMPVIYTCLHRNVSGQVPRMNAECVTWEMISDLRQWFKPLRFVTLCSTWGACHCARMWFRSGCSEAVFGPKLIGKLCRVSTPRRPRWPNGSIIMIILDGIKDKTGYWETIYEINFFFQIC